MFFPSRMSFYLICMDYLVLKEGETNERTLNNSVSKKQAVKSL